MQKRLKLFRESRIIKNYEILGYKFSSNFLYMKAKLSFINNDSLYVKEFISTIEYSYSFHWQNQNGELITRWDNAPHHKNIKTYPHHKHATKIEESYETTLFEVINYIEKIILG